MNEWINKIHHGKCEDLIPKLPNDFIDLVITSPPYNVELEYDYYKDCKPYKDYINWLFFIFKELKEKMKFGGRICINIGDKQNGKVSLHSDITQFMTKELGYLLKSTIIWNKNQIGNRTSWGSWKSPSNPSFPTPFEYILIFCNESYKKVGDKKDITISKEEFITNSLALWNFAPEVNISKLGHPAAFPPELPHRLIQQLSYRNDIVLDIFSGSGTTCLEAVKLERNWIGFEMSKNYVEISRRRINKYMDQTRLKF
jgi:modification methylase